VLSITVVPFTASEPPKVEFPVTESELSGVVPLAMTKLPGPYPCSVSATHACGTEFTVSSGESRVGLPP
jgi:hypothetical protein